MISNNIEELREHLSFTKDAMDKYFDKLRSADGELDSNDVSLSQSIALASEYVDHIETTMAIALAQLESGIESGEMSFDIPLDEFEIDDEIESNDILKVIKNIVIDEIKDEDILKVIKNNRFKLCNKFCMFVCKDIFNDIINKGTVEPKSIFDDPEKLSEEIGCEMLEIIYETAKMEKGKTSNK